MNPFDIMQTDEASDHVQDSDSQSQQQTQSTQQASQQTNLSVDSHLWGYLQPCSPTLTRIDFWKINPRYTIGRNTQTNQVVLPGFKISNNHCLITWDGSEDMNSTVMIHDLSSNGTFINGVKIGKNNFRILREGNEIAFGTPLPQPQNGGLEDYRFVYRHTAAGPPTSGLYAHYDISTELGKGSFATVRKAVSRATGEWYAVKMIQDNKKGIGIRNTSLAREITIMERLKHPNICELKEVFFQDNGDINLVLEFVEGGDLLEYIMIHNGVPEANAKHITYQMCHALSYIHAQGITHRDLKPENILLTKDDPPNVKVADFGLAKIVDSLTMLRTMCGTPSYLAPEVVKQENQEGYDNAVDSWSVGVIVFSMLTNSSPFIEDENQRDVRTRIIERRIDWGALMKPNISLDAQSFIRSLLEENPLRRMSLTNALGHPWLASCASIHDGHQLEPNVLSCQADSDTASTARSDGSQVIPLQRRSYLLSQAAEEGHLLPEPSEEMIAHAVSQAAPVSKGQNKRLHSEITPLSEELIFNGEHINTKGDQNQNAPPSNSAEELSGAVEDRRGAEDDAHAPTPQIMNEEEGRRSRRRGTKARRHC
ncbi:CAMK/RAD53 protein kinase [Amanita muscaria]